MARLPAPVVAGSPLGVGPPWRICGSAAGWRGRGRRWSAGGFIAARSTSLGVLQREHSDLQPRKAAVDRPGRWSATGRSARRPPTSARSSFRKAAGRPAASWPRPWPASRPTARRGCWSSPAPCRVPCARALRSPPERGVGWCFGAIRTSVIQTGDRRRAGDYSNEGQQPSSSWRPVRAGRYCPAAAGRRPSRPPSVRRGGRRRPSGFRRSGRSGEQATLRICWGISDSRSVRTEGPAAPGWRRRAGPSGRIPSIREASRRPDPESASCGAPCRRRAASFSICFGVGMRQLAGRSVIPSNRT